MKKEPQMIQKIDNAVYIAGWCLLAAGGIYLFITQLFNIHFTKYLIPCLFYTITGYYCPGCGGTRAMITLLNGELLTSIRYHPVVFYAAAVSGWFMVSQTIERITKGRLRIGMHYRDIYLWIALLIVIVNVIIKNAALIIWQTDLLAG